MEHISHLGMWYCWSSWSRAPPGNAEVFIPVYGSFTAGNPVPGDLLSSSPCISLPTTFTPSEEPQKKQWERFIQESAVYGVCSLQPCFRQRNCHPCSPGALRSFPVRHSGLEPLLHWTLLAQGTSKPAAPRDAKAPSRVQEMAGLIYNPPCTEQGLQKQPFLPGHQAVWRWEPRIRGGSLGRAGQEGPGSLLGIAVLSLRPCQPGCRHGSREQQGLIRKQNPSRQSHSP